MGGGGGKTQGRGSIFFKNVVTTPTTTQHNLNLKTAVGLDMKMTLQTSPHPTHHRNSISGSRSPRRTDQLDGPAGRTMDGPAGWTDGRKIFNFQFKIF